MLLSANVTVEKWKTPTRFPSMIFITKLPSSPSRLIDDWIVIP